MILLECKLWIVWVPVSLSVGPGGFSVIGDGWGDYLTGFYDNQEHSTHLVTNFVTQYSILLPCTSRDGNFVVCWSRAHAVSWMRLLQTLWGWRLSERVVGLVQKHKHTTKLSPTSGLMGGMLEQCHISPFEDGVRPRRDFLFCWKEHLHPQACWMPCYRMHPF